MVGPSCFCLRRVTRKGRERARALVKDIERRIPVHGPGDVLGEACNVSDVVDVGRSSAFGDCWDTAMPQHLFWLYFWYPEDQLVISDMMRHSTSGEVDAGKIEEAIMIFMSLSHPRSNLRGLTGGR